MISTYVHVHTIGAGPPTGVSKIGNGLAGATGVVDAVHVPHPQGEVEADEELHV